MSSGLRDCGCRSTSMASLSAGATFSWVSIRVESSRSLCKKRKSRADISMLRAELNIFYALQSAQHSMRACVCSRMMSYTWDPFDKIRHFELSIHLPCQLCQLADGGRCCCSWGMQCKVICWTRAVAHANGGERPWLRPCTSWLMCILDTSRQPVWIWSCPRQCGASAQLIFQGHRASEPLRLIQGEGSDAYDMISCLVQLQVLHAACAR